MPLGYSKPVFHFLVQNWQRLSKKIIQHFQWFFGFLHSMDNDCKKKCLNLKMQIKRIRRIPINSNNFRHFLLSCNPFWWAAIFWTVLDHPNYCVRASITFFGRQDRHCGIYRCCRILFLKIQAKLVLSLVAALLIHNFFLPNCTGGWAKKHLTWIVPWRCIGTKQFSPLHHNRFCANTILFSLLWPTGNISLIGLKWNPSS